MNSDHGQSETIRFFSGVSEQFAMDYRFSSSLEERVRIWHDLLDEHAVPGGTALDVGCGTGIFSFYLAEKGMEVTGIDGADQMIELCHREKRKLAMENVQFYKAEFPLLHGIRPEKSDLIISSSMLEYVEDLEANLLLIASLLNRPGTFIVSMPNASCINRKYQRLKYRLRQKPEIYKHIRNLDFVHLIDK